MRMMQAPRASYLLVPILLTLGPAFSANTNAGDPSDKSSGGPSLRDKSKNGRPYGIERRIPWTTSRITGTPEPPPPYTIERVFGNLEFTNPVVLTNAPATDR